MIFFGTLHSAGCIFPFLLCILLLFVRFKSEFCNKEFMIWATVSSQFCFCWLYRAFPSLTAPSEHLWQAWGLILHAILPLLLSYWCFSFALECRISFFGGIQHCPMSVVQQLLWRFCSHRRRWVHILLNGSNVYGYLSERKLKHLLCS